MCKKKTKIGTVKIKVTQGKLADGVTSALNSVYKPFPSPAYLSPYMNINTLDLGRTINEVLNNKSYGVSIKKNEYKFLEILPKAMDAAKKDQDNFDAVPEY